MTAIGVRARTLRLRAGGGQGALDGVTLTVRPGSVLVIAGASGAGKTTLLEVLAGVRPPDEGTVTHGGRPPAPRAGGFGYVPQDDIVHRDLPLARTLRYAAGLRLPAGTGAAGIGDAVRRVLDDLGLSGVADRRVGLLSGGERKRASIAVELLTRPRVLFLDEPTSGLDPAAGAALLGLLRELAHQGTTIVLTTHTPADLRRADSVAFLAPGGRLVYRGAPEGLLEHFGAESVEEAYGAAAEAPSIPDETGESEIGDTGPAEGAVEGGFPKTLGPVRQWWLLTRRSAEILARNRLSAAVLAGSPLVIIAMFAMLFRPGAFDPAAPDPASTAMICFWIAFGAFFFGLTYGLLQICTELPVVRRERLTVLRLGPYLLAKAAVLLPRSGPG